MQWLTAHAVQASLASAGELALIDVREHGQYGEGHPLLAVNIPYSRLEVDAPARLPNMSARIVLLDDGDSVADKAARRLSGLGYAQLAILEGGARAWAAAGFTLFKGEHVPSKAFGELLEDARHTPGLDPTELKSWQETGRPFVLLDGRTPEEYRRMTLPGSVACPNAELGHRLRALVPDETTPIVVHCAGRTRSILGVESLRALGVKNPLYALRNGTQGWRLAGFELEHGADRLYPEINAAAQAASRTAATAFRARVAVPAIDRETLEAWRADADRTLYLFDVRTSEEYVAGHLPGARHAPGGQLVQATDRWIAVRGARVVLSDDTGLRAAVATYWLRAMGHEAVVLDRDVTALGDLEQGTEPEPGVPATLQTLLPQDLPGAARSGVVLLDLAPSMAYRRAHLDGARWAIRPRLDRLDLEAGAPIVLLADDQRVAELAAVDLREMGHDHLRVALGGPEIWRGTGLEVTATPDDPPDEASIDHLFFVHDRHAGNLDASRAYLDWEMNLVKQMDAGERAIFQVAP